MTGLGLHTITVTVVQPWDLSRKEELKPPAIGKPQNTNTAFRPIDKRSLVSLTKEHNDMQLHR